MRGVHAGAVVLLGVLALNVGNYLFHLIAARELGPARYGDLATLVAIAGLIALWLTSLAVPRWLASLMPVVIVPLVDSVCCTSVPGDNS